MDQLEHVARRRLPRSVYAALVAGSERGQTVEDNRAAFAELGFAPRVIRAPRPGTSAMGTSALGTPALGTPALGTPVVGTSVLGQTCALPVVVSPVGVQAVHPDAEVALARAAASRGVPMGLSMFASRPIEEVVRANAATFFQLHWVAGREGMATYVERAARAGAAGLILTLDWSFSSGRDSGSPRIPQTVGAASMLRFAPEVMVRPRWLARFVCAGRLPDLTVPNIARDGVAPTFFAAYDGWAKTPPPTWADVAWLAELWSGPLLLKGICRVDDASRAVDAGVAAISVSNHGGNNLDGTPASVRCLAAVAEAVGDQVEVLLDGGIRWGSDVVKAVALGARAVLIGRASLWGVAARGQRGVEEVLDSLHDGAAAAMAALGCFTIAGLRTEDLVVPAGFARSLGGVSPGQPSAS